ncbi:MAG TPA: AraC family transcriptional regulator [Puia sp.]|nr:AraC family transcriptional regulator [Puia sp.]
MQFFGKGEYSGDVVNFSSQDGFMVSITTYQQSNFNHDRHSHDNTHISFVLHGGCAEKKKNPYERLPGKITYYHSGEPHQVTNVAARSKHINIEIEPAFFRAQQLSENDLFDAMSENPDAKFLMLDIYRELVDDDDYSGYSIHSHILNLVHRTTKFRTNHEKPLWVNIVKEHLHDNWRLNTSLLELASVAKVHPVTISRYFPKYLGCTLGQYMRKIKVEKSLSLIKAAHSSLTGVAYECGFSDQSHFIRNFKNLTGFLPAHYRQL